MNNTILITGAAGGMGRACALLAADRGYNVTLLDLDAGKLAAVADECAGKGAKTACHALDICDPRAIERFGRECASGEKLSAAIHTAGLSPRMAAWDKIIQVDLVGTLQLVEALKPAISPGGCSVVIASMSAHMVPPNPDVDTVLSDAFSPDLLQKVEGLDGQPLSTSGLAYAYAKRALLMYVAARAPEWGVESKRLVSISPGLIDTPMGQLEADSDKDAYAYMRGLIALQRDGNPDEIASAALFLASADASYISGCDLLVDGGFVGAFKAQQAKAAQ